MGVTDMGAPAPSQTPGLFSESLLQVPLQHLVMCCFSSFSLLCSPCSCPFSFPFRFPLPSLLLLLSLWTLRARGGAVGGEGVALGSGAQTAWSERGSATFQLFALELRSLPPTPFPPRGVIKGTK